ALLWRRTRWFAFAAAALFNITNAILFQIGIFPFLALGATVLLFLDYRSIANRLAALANACGFAIRSTLPKPIVEIEILRNRKRTLTPSLLAAWLAFQIFMPLRHLL